VKVVEAREENFNTHQEKINELDSSHSKVDCNEDSMEKPDEEKTREDEIL
jgi:hypothetical protein